MLQETPRPTPPGNVCGVAPIIIVGICVQCELRNAPIGKALKMSPLLRERKKKMSILVSRASMADIERYLR